MTSLVGFPGDIALARDAQRLKAFASDLEGEGALPLGIARPSGIEHIVDVVQWANRRGVPLVPFSSRTGPRRRGDTLSRSPGLMLDLSGLERVIHVDGDDRIAVVEPGVTFAAFDAALAPHGLRSFKPLLPRRGKSVIASHLEREPVTSPYDHWDTSDPLSSIELVFGSGERFRTGGAAAPGTLEENLRRGLRQMISSGPIATDFTRVLQGAQGSLGVVCWGSVYCERIPPIEQACFVASDDLSALVALAYATLRRRVAGQLFIVDRVQLAIMVAGTPGAVERPQQLPRWILYANMMAAPNFPQEHLAYVQADFVADARQSGLSPVTSLGGIEASQLHALLQVPPEDDYKQRFRGAYSDFLFLSQLSKAQAFVDAVDQLQASQARGVAAGFYLQPLVQGVTCHIEVTFPHRPDERAVAQALRTRAVEACAARGAFFSRPYAPWGKAAFAVDPQARRTIAKIKQLLDPQGVMNPCRFSD